MKIELVENKVYFNNGSEKKEIHPFWLRERVDGEEYLDKGKTKIGLVFNTDPHYKDGSHWIALFIDIKKKFIYFFDSNGNFVPKRIEKFVKRVQKQAKFLCNFWGIICLRKKATAKLNKKTNKKAPKKSMNKICNTVSSRIVAPPPPSNKRPPSNSSPP